MEHTVTLDDAQERGLAEEAKRTDTDPEVLVALYVERGLGVIVAELNQANKDRLFAAFGKADMGQTKAEIMTVVAVVAKAEAVKP